MNISLTTTLEKLVREKVQSGLYHSASEVIRAGLRLLKEQDISKEQRLRDLKREIAIGLEQAERGELMPLDIEKIKTEGRKIMAIKRKAA